MPRAYFRHSAGQTIFYPGNTGPGDEWFVDSTNGLSTNTGKDWENALATIDQGINKCTASNGDTVYVAPFHAETITADSGVDIDLAGVQVVGVTRGREMPTITFDTAVTADFKLAAANVSIQNLRFLSGINALTGPIEVSAADCAIINCEFRETSTYETVDAIVTTAAAERLLIDGYRHIGALTDGANSAIAIVGGIEGLIIRNCHIMGTFAVGNIDFRTVKSTEVWIHDCYLWNNDDTVIGSGGVPCIMDTITASTGTIGPNIQCVLGTDEANVTEAVTGATFHVVDPVYVVNAVNQKAVAIDWSASA